MRDSGVEQFADAVRSYGCIYRDNSWTRSAPTGVSTSVGAHRMRDTGVEQFADAVRSYKSIIVAPANSAHFLQ
jgi:hypothetical protein